MKDERVGRARFIRWLTWILLPVALVLGYLALRQTGSVAWLAAMSPAAGSGTEQSQTISASGIVEVTARVPRLELNAGKYAVSVIAITEDQSRVLCRHDNAAYVQVEAATASGAHVLAAADWVATESLSSSALL